jgi:hypothetical protein
MPNIYLETIHCDDHDELINCANDEKPLCVSQLVDSDPTQNARFDTSNTTSRVVWRFDLRKRQNMMVTLSPHTVLCGWACEDTE